MIRTKIPVDVICQHSQDGALIPIRIRMKDAEGLFQTYTVKEFKDLSHLGSRLMPDGVYVTDDIFVFECKITVFDTKKLIRLYYDTDSLIWHMTY